jgi:hypothetical protein
MGGAIVGDQLTDLGRSDSVRHAVCRNVGRAGWGSAVWAGIASRKLGEAESRVDEYDTNRQQTVVRVPISLERVAGTPHPLTPRHNCWDLYQWIDEQ